MTALEGDAFRAGAAAFGRHLPAAPVARTRQAVNVYVGADNQTGKIDLDAVARIVARDVDAFTILPAQGYWHGAPEPSAMIIIDSDTASIARVVARLRTELGQDAIAVQPAPGLCLDTQTHACVDAHTLMRP